MYSWENDPDEAIIQVYLMLAKQGVTMLPPTIAQFPGDRPFPVSRYCRAKCVAAKLLNVNLQMYVLPPVSREQLDEIRTEVERVEVEWLRARMQEFDEKVKGFEERKRRKEG
jgi:hypothetical protein